MKRTEQVGSTTSLVFGYAYSILMLLFLACGYSRVDLSKKPPTLNHDVTLAFCHKPSSALPSSHTAHTGKKYVGRELEGSGCEWHCQTNDAHAPEHGHHVRPHRLWVFITFFTAQKQSIVLDYKSSKIVGIVHHASFERRRQF